MIAYEDLDKALARWKARRSGAGAGSDGSATTGGANTPGMVVETVASFEVRESTGELDLADAVLDET